MSLLSLSLRSSLGLSDLPVSLQPFPMGISNASNGTGIYLIFCLNSEFLGAHQASTTPELHPPWPSPNVYVLLSLVSLHLPAEGWHHCGHFPDEEASQKVAD